MDSILEAQLHERIMKMVHPHPKMLPNFWDPTISKIVHVPVNDGTIRVFHYRPQYLISKRPIVIIPGWGVIPSGFRDVFEIFYNYIEFYYIETREKKSSRINRKTGSFSMEQNALDVKIVLEHFNLVKKDFVLMGTCWGSSIILYGLINHILQAPTYVLVDPMHRLQYPHWFLNMAPIIPVWLIWLLKPLLTYLKLRNHSLPTQRKRIIEFIHHAVLWKWKKAAFQARNFELLGNLAQIREEVFIFNATTDVIHDQRKFALIAQELPNARFFYMKISEELRERLIGLIGVEFASELSNTGCPIGLIPYEKKIIRQTS